MLKGRAETQTQQKRKQVQKSKLDDQQPSWSILRDDLWIRLHEGVKVQGLG